ncbi:UDP-N-acetylmuramate dehydrogenase [Streptosporangium subroseum]|uniref:UDP-N-acetylenolpyruvoylglucosamine reductase n=1 Tax=Streptosporangium subroseum TaxID=106412 RepID=A0A239JLJ3_9ACTN|nr:UDP-N-acetylmuramate dehydrogenase [Streptosporangium subroseum]SNT06278.1 UDP-N-acetylmuramate dehydrogenase [Streptosporangium subroseum]
MGERLADHTTLQFGGPADQLLTHADPAAWADTSRMAARHHGTPVVLGHGSNVLAADAGYSGPVICMATQGITVRSAPEKMVDVTVQAGHPLAGLIDFAVAEGLSGLEYLTGIPGTIGAAPIQNTGAYGQQISDTLIGLTAYDWQTGDVVNLAPVHCGFGYRTSLFKRHPARWTILDVTIRLLRSNYASPVTYQHLADALDVSIGVSPPLAEAAEAVLINRSQRGLTLPATGPDARQVGSVFLNPPLTPKQAETVRATGGPLHRTADGAVRGSAGWLLQHVGYGCGQRLALGVYCSALRTLTVVARTGATAATFATTLQNLAAQVHEATGIYLHPEPVSLGALMTVTSPISTA